MKMKQDFDFNKYIKYFKESEFWNKAANVARRAGVKLIYSALLLYFVMRDENVPQKSKWLIAGALGYFILPTDFVPDFIPVVGFIDDLSALLFALGEVTYYITPEIQENAKNKIAEWFGTFDEEEVKDIDSRVGSEN